MMDVSTMNRISQSLEDLRTLFNNDSSMNTSYTSLLSFFRDYGTQQSFLPVSNDLRTNLLNMREALPVLNEFYIETQNFLPHESRRNPIPDHVFRELPVTTVDQNLVEKEDSCIICLNKFSLNEEILVLSCRHVHHKVCIEGWFQESNTCPICGIEVYENEEPNFDSSNMYSISNRNNPSSDLVSNVVFGNPSFADILLHFSYLGIDESSRRNLRRLSEQIFQFIHESPYLNNLMTEVTEASLDEPPQKNPVPDHIVQGLPVVILDEKMIEKNYLCVICKDEFSLNEQVLILPCKHAFHEDCIKEWFKEQNGCPCCRFKVYEDDSTNGIEEDSEELPDLEDYFN